MKTSFFQLLKIILFLLWLNPVIFLKRMYLELRYRFTVFPQSPTTKTIYGLNFTFYFEEASSRRKMYLGMYEMGVVHSMETLLRPGDTFIDTGANVGYLTAVGAGLVGTRGEVHSFEPVPWCVKRIRQLAADNPTFHIVVNEVAVGSTEGILPLFISNKSMGQSSAAVGILKKEDIRETIQTHMVRLDSYIEEKKIHQVKLIKIDVEGFEFEVLCGLERFLAKAPGTFLICEIVPEAYGKPGHSMEDMFGYLEKFSYFPYSVVNPSRKISHDLIKKQSTINVLFKPR